MSTNTEETTMYAAQSAKIKKACLAIGNMIFDLNAILPDGDPRRTALSHLQNASHTLVTGESAFRVARKRRAKASHLQQELPAPVGNPEETHEAR